MSIQPVKPLGNSGNVLLGITGCIAAYKACTLIRILKKQDFQVKVIMTKNATRFITPLTISTLSENVVMEDMWENRSNVEHIDIAKWADIFVVYPATVNIIAKFANGIADDVLSTVYLALGDNKKKLIFPAANENMYLSKPNGRNMLQLRRDNCYIYTPDKGTLVCGDEGIGKLQEPLTVFKEIDKLLGERK